MADERAVDILKGAILLERKGKAFYENIAKQTSSEAVKEIFVTMAKEEAKHIEVLTRHFKSVLKDGKLDNIEYENVDYNPVDSVLTDKVKMEISASGYEAAAISAAMSLEENAINFYSEQANSAEDTLEKELFSWLSSWEKTHLKLLIDIDKELTENIWYDSKFWPMG